nr:zf-CCHC domain-containing protein/UBN2 domain-containing protein [Tanacetum cinerariifolium]
MSARVNLSKMYRSWSTRGLSSCEPILIISSIRSPVIYAKRRNKFIISSSRVASTSNSSRSFIRIVCLTSCGSVAVVFEMEVAWGFTSKWRAKVTAIEESKDLSSLALDELIENLKEHEVVIEKDFKIYKGKRERIKSIALKAKKESSDDETSTSGSDDEEYAMAVRNFKNFLRRKGNFVRKPREERKSLRQKDEKKGKSDQKCFRCSDPSHLIGDCPKTSRNKD